MQGALDKGGRVRFRVSSTANGNHGDSGIDREWIKDKNNRARMQRSIGRKQRGRKINRE
jgi:hypothetical protein